MLENPLGDPAKLLSGDTPKKLDFLLHPAGHNLLTSKQAQFNTQIAWNPAEVKPVITPGAIMGFIITA
jgi:hypothetical protein